MASERLDSQQTVIYDDNATYTVFLGDHPASTIDATIEEIVERARIIRAAGTDSYKFTYKTFGRIRVFWYKEVGPPPWKYPRIGLFKMPRGIRVLTGWRSTAYCFGAVVLKAQTDG